VGGLFGAIRAAGLALQAQEQVMSVTANNIANVQTPGYEQEQANLAPAPPMPPPGLNMPAGPGQMGTGVVVEGVNNQDSPFLDQQSYAANAGLNDQQTVQSALTQVQAILNEPSTHGLSSALTAFWNDWQSLANDPSNVAARTTVISQGQTVAQTFNSINGQLTQLQSSLDGTVASQVQQVNEMASQIATLNQQIVAVTATGQEPNTLQDQRNALLTKLSAITQFQLTPQQSGGDVITIGGVNLVDGNQTTTLVATPNSANHGYEALSWQGSTAGVQLGQGSLAQSINLRDNTIPSYESQLDALANALATAVNGHPTTAPGATAVTGATTLAAGTYEVAYTIVTPQGETEASPVATVTLTAGGEISIPPVTVPAGDTVNYYMSNAAGSTTLGLAASGSGTTTVALTALPSGTAAAPPTAGMGQYGGYAIGASTPTQTDFFTGSTAAAIAVNATLAASPSLIGAAATPPGTAGDGNNALNIADIQNQTWAGNATIGDAYSAVVSQLGAQASAAGNNVQTQQLLVTSIQQEQSSVSGVDLNQELSNMVASQQAYGAAADVIQVVNQMLGALISSV
jgi:flagellar hook-associated protein 1 FlgK